MEIQASPLRTVLARDPADNAADIRCSVIEMDDSATDCTVSHDRLSFWVPLQGRCDVHTIAAARPFAFSGDKIAVYPPGGSWRGSWRGRTTCALLEIGPSVLHELGGEKIQFPDRRHAAIVKDDKIRYSVLAAHQDLLAPSTGSDQFVQHVARGVALHYLERYCGKAAAESSRSEPRLSASELRQVTEFIEANLQTRIHLGEMARLLGMNATTFSRRFRETTGIPPYRYVQRTRIDLAKKALVHNRGAALSELALSLGFYDQSQFTNTFRKLIGLSPSDYRRLHFS